MTKSLHVEIKNIKLLKKHDMLYDLLTKAFQTSKPDHALFQ